MLVFSKRNIRKYQISESKSYDYSFSVIEGKIVHWLKLENGIAIGVTIEELERILAELQFMHSIVKQLRDRR